MNLFFWLRPHRRQNQPRPVVRRARPAVEVLEGREVLSTSGLLGLAFNPLIGPPVGPNGLVRVDPTDGSFTGLGSTDADIPFLSAAALDATNDRLYFYGIETVVGSPLPPVPNNHFYVIDTQTGTQLVNQAIAGSPPAALELDTDSGTLVGIETVFNLSGPSVSYFVNVDSATGAFTRIGDALPVEGLITNSAVLDSAANRLYFYGFVRQPNPDPLSPFPFVFENHFFEIDSTTGALLNDEVLAGTFVPTDVQMDTDTGTLYGVQAEFLGGPLGTGSYFLVTIDRGTGATTHVAELSVNGVFTGNVALDSASDTLYLYGFESIPNPTPMFPFGTLQVSHFYAVDTQTGLETTNVTLPGAFPSAIFFASPEQQQASPTFSNLSSPTLVVGTDNVVLGGRLSADNLAPSGTVQVTLNGVTNTATLGADGTFSTTFAVGNLTTGTYTVSYQFAGNADFQAASATSTVTVTYDVEAQFDGTKAKKAGSALPVRIALLDADGAPIAGLTVRAVGVASTTNPTAIVPVQSKGNSNPDNVFRSVGSDYQFNLDTTGLSAGTYLFYFQIDGDPLDHEVMFVIR